MWVSSFMLFAKLVLAKMGNARAWGERCQNQRFEIEQCLQQKTIQVLRNISNNSVKVDLQTEKDNFMKWEISKSHFIAPLNDFLVGGNKMQENVRSIIP